MKKLLLLLLSITISAAGLSACGGILGGNSSSKTSISDSLETEPSSDDSSAEKVCKITFKQSGEKDVIKEVKVGESLTDIPEPAVKTGYTVVWDTTDFSNVTEDLVVEAEATPNKYTITYDAGEGTVTPATQEVTFDSEVELATPTREGYDFTGWTYEGKGVLGTWTIADNVTLVAGWQAKVVQKCTVTFAQSGYEAVTREVVLGGSLAEADIPKPQEQVGYTVTWEEVDLTNIQSNITVKAEPKPNDYTITYDAGEGTATPETQTVTYDSIPQTFATATREGYYFKGWTYEGKTILATDVWKIADNVTLVATWEEIQKYTVTFTQTGYEPIVITVNEGTSLTETDIPQPQEQVGYTVTWKEADLTNIQSNITVEADPKPNDYTITYDAGEGTATPETQTVTYDSIPQTFATATREGYDFTGWTYEGKTILATDVWKIAENVTLVATWAEIQKYTVTFAQTGYEPIVITVEEGDSLTETDIPQPQEQVGYTVTWKEVDLTNIQSNIVVEADPKPNDYIITYDAGEGTATLETQTVTYDSIPQTFATAMREDYNFMGWAYEGKTVLATDVWKIAENVTLVAQWEEIQKYTVTFTQTGYEPIVITVKEGTSLTEADIPTPQTQVGYTVTWKEADLTNIQSNITVEADPKPNDYTITYDAGEGTATLETQTVTYDSIPQTFATATRDGYDFAGWTYEGKAILATDVWKIANNVTLVAKWDKIINTYTVTFRQAGQVDQVFECVVENTAFTTIPTPVAKTGYTVTWNEQQLAALENVTGNIVVEAVEKVKTYTIKLKALSGYVENTTLTVTYGQAYELPTPTHTNEDYRFRGWKYGSTTVPTSGVWNIDGEETIELVAIWREVGWTGNY